MKPENFNKVMLQLIRQQDNLILNMTCMLSNTSGYCSLSKHILCKTGNVGVNDKCFQHNVGTLMIFLQIYMLHKKKLYGVLRCVEIDRLYFKGGDKSIL